MSRSSTSTPDGPGDSPDVVPAWPDGAQPLYVVRADARGGATDWMARGACRGSDPELFFPIASLGSAAGQIEAAKAICGRCVVRKSCRSYALRTMPDGIWGGMTREERAAVRARSILRARARAQEPETAVPARTAASQE